MDKRKVIVSGRPRSGTSMMMKILDLSGYKCLRDMDWEEKIRPGRKNEYFYEHRGLVHEGNISLLDGYDAGKVMPKALPNLPPDRVVVIWMDRDRESVVASQAAYGRDKMIKRDLYEDYDQWDVEKLLEPFAHVRLSYEALTQVVNEHKRKLSANPLP